MLTPQLYPPQLDSAVTNAESWAQFLYYEKHGYTAKEDAHPMRLFVLFFKILPPPESWPTP